MDQEDAGNLDHLMVVLVEVADLVSDGLVADDQVKAPALSFVLAGYPQ